MINDIHRTTKKGHVVWDYPYNILVAHVAISICLLLLINIRIKSLDNKPTSIIELLYSPNGRNSKDKKFCIIHKLSF